VPAIRPYLLLDVDGVLNPFAAEVCPEPYREYDFFPGEDAVRLADVHGEWLRDLARTFDLVWATGWGHQADQFIAPTLGLPRLPVILFPRIAFDPALKVPAIDDYVGDRPLAWLDDIVTPEAQSWAAARTAPTLLVAVDPAVGLTAEIVAELKRWAAGIPIEARASADPIGEERV
jgi:hypothetical protein